MTDHTTHDLAIARAERDAWQSTCEELHRTIAGRDVEIEAHLGRIEAADQRARSFEAALTAEREASKGLVAQVEALRADSRHHAAIAAQNATLASERDAHAAELAAIRDLVAPGNPQGTVVDAVRAMATGLIESIGARDAAEQARDMARDSRDAAIARAEAAERDARELRATVNGIAGRLGCAEDVGAVLRRFGDLCVEVDDLRAKVGEVAVLTATRDRLLAREHEDGRLHAQLRAELAELAELRARPVLTEDLLRGALDAHGYAGLTRKLFAHLGPVTLPLAELRARPVLTDERLRDAMATAGLATGAAAWVLAALGPVTLPSPDRAEELCRRYHNRLAVVGGNVRPPSWDEYTDGSRADRVSVMREELAALAKLSPAPAPAFDTAFLRRVMVATKHGPNGKGGPGPCDAACVKCEAELMAKAAPAREVAPTRVLVHADGGACHGSRVVDGRCVGCGIAPDMQSTSMWLDADARPVQCEPAKVVAPTLVAVSDEELAVAFYSEPERPALRECIDAADLAGIRAVRAKLGAAEVTADALTNGWIEATGFTAPEVLKDAEVVRAKMAHAIVLAVRATAAKGG